MSRVQAVVFDWGGTLMRTLPDLRGPMAEWPRVELVPGVAEALDRLPRELVRCVATNAIDSDAELLGLALERGGIRHHFAHLFTPRELGALKPDPRFFRRILRTLGVEAPAAVMVGDAYASDICAASAVGMRTIWFAEARPSRPAPCADRVISAMADLPTAVAMLARQCGAKSEP